jgi:hypothetical protein
MLKTMAWPRLVGSFALVSALAAAAVQCGGNGSLPEPLSTNQADDPDDPGAGSPNPGAAPPVDAGATPLSLPGGSAGIGFDDLRYSANLAQLLVPAGRTGDLDLVDPSTEAIASIAGFSSEPEYTGDATFGVTSADEGGDIVYATDRTTLAVVSIDPRQQKITATLTLAAAPGYVRYVEATSEVWVTEPGAKQIEVVSLSGADGGPGLSHATSIPVDGAESLEVDATSGMAFTNAAGTTLAIDTTKRTVSARWSNGCTAARGIGLDPGHGWVIVACNEGRLVVLDEHTGATLGKLTTGGGLDRIAYDRARQRVYVPSPSAAAMSVVLLSSAGIPRLLGQIQTTSDAHCVVTPGGGEVFVCSPSKGQLASLFDPF